MFICFKGLGAGQIPRSWGEKKRAGGNLVVNAAPVEIRF